MFSSVTQKSELINAASGVRTELMDLVMAEADPVALDFYLASLDPQTIEFEAQKVLALEYLVDRLMAELGMTNVSDQAVNVMHLRNLVCEDIVLAAEEWGCDLGDEEDEDGDEDWDDGDYDGDDE